MGVNIGNVWSKGKTEEQLVSELGNDYLLEAAREGRLAETLGQMRALEEVRQTGRLLEVVYTLLQQREETTDRIPLLVAFDGDMANPCSTGNDALNAVEELKEMGFTHRPVRNLVRYYKDRRGRTVAAAISAPNSGLINEFVRSHFPVQADWSKGMVLRAQASDRPGIQGRTAAG